MIAESVMDWVITHRTSIINGLITGLILTGVFTLVKRFWDQIWSLLPSPSPFTPEGRMEKAKKMLDRWYTIWKDGEIVLRPPPGAALDSHLPEFRKGLLYIFAARDAYDMGRRKTPEVTQYELAEKSIFCDSGFLSSMGVRIDEVESVEVDCNKEVLVVDGHKEAFEMNESDREKEVIEIDEVDCDKEMSELKGEEERVEVFKLGRSKADDIAVYIKQLS